MTILLLFYGSRGDIQPGVCLGLELARRGRDVTMAVPPNYVDFVNAVGLRAVPVGFDSESYWKSERAQRILSTRNPVTKVRLAGEQVREGFARYDADLTSAVSTLVDTTDIEGIVSGPLGQERALAFAESLNVPLVTMRFCAMSVNGAISAIPTSRTLPALVNRAGWRLTDRIAWTFARSSENRFRASIGVRPARSPLPQRLSRRSVTQIQAYDPLMFPGLTDEWGADRPLTGFLDLPDSARDALGDRAVDDPDLYAWMDDGQPPIFVAFGNAPVARPEPLRQAISTVADEMGARVVVGFGPGPDGSDRSAGRVSSSVYVARRFDHAALLPRFRAAVHHGGAGTTAASLRAGLPTMVCSAGADQMHWGAQVQRLGVGTRSRLAALDAARLREGIAVLLRSETASAAQRLAARLIRPDAAVAAAADATETALIR